MSTVSLPVPESMVSAVRVGVPVEVEVSSLNRSFPGKIARFAGQVDTATRTMTTASMSSCGSSS